MILICIILFIFLIIFILIYTKFDLFSKKRLVSDNNNKIISDSDKHNFPFSNWRIVLNKQIDSKIVKLDKSSLIIKNFVTVDQCNKVIHTSQKYKIDMGEDIDNKPMYQFDIFSGPTQLQSRYALLRKEGFEIEKEDEKQQEIYNTELYNDIIVFIDKIKNILGNINLPNGKKKYQLDYVFLRRYRHNERKSFTIHFDENHITTMILLSDKKADFEGGDFYIFDDKMSKKYQNVNCLDSINKEKFINNWLISPKYNKLPVVDLDKGDLILFTSDHLHGTIDIKKGTRYTILFFWNII